MLEIQLRVGEKIGGAEKLQRLISPFAPEAKSEVLKGLDKSAATFLGYFSSGPLSSYVGELFWGILEKPSEGIFWSVNQRASGQGWEKTREMEKYGENWSRFWFWHQNHPIHLFAALSAGQNAVY